MIEHSSMWTYVGNPYLNYHSREDHLSFIKVALVCLHSNGNPMTYDSNFGRQASACSMNEWLFSAHCWASTCYARTFSFSLDELRVGVMWLLDSALVLGFLNSLPLAPYLGWNFSQRDFLGPEEGQSLWMHFWLSSFFTYGYSFQATDWLSMV